MVKLFILLLTAFVVAVVYLFYDRHFYKQHSLSRADALAQKKPTEDVQLYMNKYCRNCTHFGIHDVCLCGKHWGTVIQNTVEYCKIMKSYDAKTSIDC